MRKPRLRAWMLFTAIALPAACSSSSSTSTSTQGAGGSGAGSGSTTTNGSGASGATSTSTTTSSGGGATSTSTTTATTSSSGAGGSGQGPFSFVVLGDNRAGADCSGNQVHMGIVDQVVKENVDFVIHVGDMMTGYNDNTNWADDGSCTSPASPGSFKKMIAPLQSKPAPQGLATSYFPVIGNHDDGWGDAWYPDPKGGGVCDVFDPKPLVPNHTQKTYYADPNAPKLDDAAFYAGLCSKQDQTIYPRFFYYSFDFRGTHFVVLHVNNDDLDLEVCNNCAGNQNDYDDYYEIHQLHWLRDDLAKAKANPATKNIFAFLHAPVFTTCDDHQATASAYALATEFTKYGVRYVFNGHDHVYERTVPIRVDAANPTGVEDDVAGTTYVTTGGAGSDLAGFNAQQWFDVKRASTYHYTRVDVNDATVSVHVTDSTGAVLDQF